MGVVEEICVMSSPYIKELVYRAMDARCSRLKYGQLAAFPHTHLTYIHRDRLKYGQLALRLQCQ